MLQQFKPVVHQLEEVAGLITALISAHCTDPRKVKPLRQALDRIQRAIRLTRQVMEAGQRSRDG